MVGNDIWCPSCGYSVDPGTRFCGGCGQQIAAADGGPAGQSSTVTVQAPPAPYPGYPGPAAPPAPPAPVPLPAGAPLPWAPPPTGAPVQPPAPGQPQPPFSDTIEQMLRPQGLFQHKLPPPVEWPQPYPPAPPAGPGQPGYPPGGQYPQAGPYQQGGPYPAPPAGQYPATGSLQQAGPPAPWPQGPTGVIPAAALPPAGPPPAPPAGGQWPQAGAYPGPYANGQYPNGPYPNGPYANDQYPNGQYPNGQFADPRFGQEQFPPGQPVPGVQYGPDGTPADGGPRAPGLLGKLPFKRPLVPLAVGGGVVVVVVAALALSSHGGSSAGNAGGAAASAKPAASSSASTSALTQQQAATALSGLLAQSGTDHADVNAAVTSVEGCKGLTADAKTFSKAAGNRRTLLSKLAQLPGRPALPAAMLTDLTNGWQASATVDQDLANWATAEAGHCKKNDLKNPAYTASLPFDSKATNGKIEFVKQWNGLAHDYGLATYQPSQI